MTDQLFPVLKIYAHDFNLRIGGNPAVAATEFAKSIHDAGLSDRQIVGGIEQFKKMAADKPFVPNPTEFVKLCKADIYGNFPTERQAYLEACKFAGFLNEASWTHPAIYVAGSAVGWFSLRNKPEKETYPSFIEQYRKALERSASGEDLNRFVPVAFIGKVSTVKASENSPNRLRALSAIQAIKNKSIDK